MNADSIRTLLVAGLFAWLPVASVVSEASAAPGTSVSVRFEDGTRSSGSLTEFLPDRVVLKPTDEPARSIPREELLAILNTSISTSRSVRPENRLELAGGQVLSGRLVAIERERVTLETGIAGELSVPRGAVKSVRWTGKRSDVQYEGPFSTNDWFISDLPRKDQAQRRPSWEFHDGIFLSQGKGTLSVECDMPTVARVEFDLYWRTPPRIRIACYVRDVMNYVDSEGYHFYSSGKGAIYALSRGGNPGRAVTVPRGMVSEFTNANQVHLDFRLNSQNGEGWLFANGREIKRWTDLGYSGVGMGVMFYSYRSEARLGVANLRVSQWDGRTTVIEEAPVKSSLVLFRNGDRMESEALLSAAGSLNFNYRGDELRVPLDRVAEIHQAGTAESTDAQALQSWIQFANGDWLRAEVLAWHADLIEWRSPLAGRQKSPLALVRGIHFTRAKPVLDLSWYLPKSPRESSE
jgi:hypothetical protein